MVWYVWYRVVCALCGMCVYVKCGMCVCGTCVCVDMCVEHVCDVCLVCVTDGHEVWMCNVVHAAYTWYGIICCDVSGTGCLVWYVYVM